MQVNKKSKNLNLKLLVYLSTPIITKLLFSGCNILFIDDFFYLEDYTFKYKSFF